ncbi:hypothetical protein H7F15_17045 [Pontibacter sp. Tf4]|uniref:hypothetical protein n=1 Tax=Pontibacter sp. Tf4 TaxID=2761620 RepID=UPI00162A1563|nr:hypothetical protein [Pontibacter sp. Tf4]MBB6612751.1 hypothetical protein [Pontibacter sp. Tf4]
MKQRLEHTDEQLLQTECGRVFGYIFKAMKLVRDEKHNFHVVYKTMTDEYIYSFCNPFLDTLAPNTYKLISEEEARKIFLPQLTSENAHELFTTAKASFALHA